MSTEAAVPLVSFVIPLYNAAAYIAQAVDSVLNQTYPNIEVVIVDDGSTDESVQIVQARYGDDARVRLISQANAGPAAARNRGIEAARGEFVHFLDSDEYLLPTKVEQSYALFVRHPEIGVVYGHGIAVKPDGVTVISMEQPPLPSGDVFCEWLTGTMSGGTHGVVSTFMVRRDALLKAGSFNETIKGTEDWDMWLRLAADWPFAALDEKLVYYRRIETGVHADRLNMARRRLQVYELAGDLPRRRDCLDDAAYERLLASRWQVVAMRYWELGQRAEARAAFREAIRLHPQQSRQRKLYALMSYVLPARSVGWLWVGTERLKRTGVQPPRSR